MTPNKQYKKRLQPSPYFLVIVISPDPVSTGYSKFIVASRQFDLTPGMRSYFVNCFANNSVSSYENSYSKMQVLFLPIARDMIHK